VRPAASLPPKLSRSGPRWSELPSRPDSRQSALASLSNAGGLLRDARYNTLLNLNLFGNLTLYAKANGARCGTALRAGPSRRHILGGPSGKRKAGDFDESH
jgi:hypothetical protein